jgi:hypothetical protein
MSERSWNILKWSGIGLVILAIVAVPYRPGRTEPVTREALAKCEQLWEQSQISSYDWDLGVSGDQTGQYHVEVRNGQPTAITLNGRPAESHAAEYFTVQGVFQTIEEELDLADNPSSQAFPPGSQVWLRMRCHPELGYPVRFIRQVKLAAQRSASGVETSSRARGIEIRVIRFEPK